MASRYLVPKGYDGITVYPLIILRKKEMLNNRVLINHEKIHIRQQVELLVVFFYLWYIIEFLARLAAVRSVYKAYRGISFEAEAYLNEKDPDYLKSRPLFNHVKYFIRQA